MTSDQLVAAPETALPTLRGAVAGLPSYVPGRRGTGADIAALASNESHYDPLPAAVAAVAEAAGRMNRYPDMAAVELRERLARHLGVTAEEVAVGPGSVGVLQQIITGLCDAGDEVVFAWRSFEAYPILVELAGARPVRVPLDDSEGHDLEAMAAAVTDRTKVLLLCTPNNPTGVPISHGRLEAFLQSVRSDILVVIDEAYVEYADAGSGPDSLALYRRYPNVCILRTFSKAYGLAGLRVGYAITTAAIADGLRRTALPFAVSALAQKAAIASLDAGEEMEARVSAVKQERARMAAELAAQGWTLQPSQGNFLWIRADDALLARLVDAFDHAGILVRAYPGDGVRITVADPASNNRVLRLLEAHAA
ncbi:histidinol-phosphate transaminase [Pseudarthrobacter niigatensis]|uniref:Aromatic amino acid aminotransferase n=1 Tax=Pseudarthrobacter niigatensis TaxID=369935 RepID=A0AAJ1SX34_9MICC|nr:histidinol-phosphate transaminase [Pseudarthrobacter niigatensis]MDQ0147319.1 histidinol-phosphate aminotransferase [Pseudarthrobacter niigatensis]MDQ0267136.1 histidinol-phosphate aminotransferase [Pseudarthrobacter niigatensis]